MPTAKLHLPFSVPIFEFDLEPEYVDMINDWADEVGNPRYILDLLLSVINLSCQTVDIVNSLPKLNFEEVKEEVDI